MSLFSDEARFNGSVLHTDGGLIAFYKESTSSDLGPGQYFDPEKDSQRLWKVSPAKKRLPAQVARREISKVATRVIDRSHHYRAGILLSSGLSISGFHNSSIEVPGPGAYSPNFKTIANSVSPKKKVRNSVAVSSPSSPSKPVTYHNVIIRDEMIVQIVGHDTSHIGPGQYNVPLSTFGTKKSFNSRVIQNLAESTKTRSPPSKYELLRDVQSFQSRPGSAPASARK